MSQWMMRRDGVGQPHAWDGNCTFEDRCEPVAIVAYEDREQVERLMDCVTWLFSNADVGTVQAALRKFAHPTPSKPECPTDLGAVVMEGDEEWVHFGNEMFIKTVPNANLRVKSWGQFGGAVRVLSDGLVTP